MEPYLSFIFCQLLLTTVLVEFQILFLTYETSKDTMDHARTAKFRAGSSLHFGHLHLPEYLTLFKNTPLLER